MEEKEILAKYLEVPIDDIDGKDHHYQSDGAYYIIGDDDFWTDYINDYCEALADDLVYENIPEFYRTYIDYDKLTRDLAYDYCGPADLDFRDVEEFEGYTIATEW